MSTPLSSLHKDFIIAPTKRLDQDLRKTAESRDAPADLGSLLVFGDECRLKEENRLKEEKAND
ncbi:MAG TPA: hypothetical protein VFU43_02480 [Streptosporangiaceae bacterium]|nr:hypothetical protein [Streptosporangiaceae bacterium]